MVPTQLGGLNTKILVSEWKIRGKRLIRNPCYTGALLNPHLPVAAMPDPLQRVHLQHRRLAPRRGQNESCRQFHLGE